MKWAALVVGLLIAASVAWFAAEQHYDNCIQDAYLERYATEEVSPRKFRVPSREQAGRKLQAALDGCGRLPF